MKTETPQVQLANKIKAVNNILLTVSKNPTVDQLASTLGLTIALTRLSKRSVAVFGGAIPPAIKFLEPEKTFENNADSLRDFIISLSKDKADRLRVRPDGDFVKVYITPYRTKITPADIKFEDGDFNIELVIALGANSRDEVDGSIASYGKIFHSATIATMNLGQHHDALGTISWQDTSASCYAQMCYNLIKQLDEETMVDEQVATALLTGVVAATDQFRNGLTTPEVMTLSANLMSHGANQQLITSELSANEQSYQTTPASSLPTASDDSVYQAMDFNRSGSQSAAPAPTPAPVSSSLAPEAPQVDEPVSQPQPVVPVETANLPQASGESTGESVNGTSGQPNNEVSETPVVPVTPAEVSEPSPTLGDIASAMNQETNEGEASLASKANEPAVAGEDTVENAYIIGNEHQVVEPPKQDNNLMFNQPNQVSPIGNPSVTDMPMPPEPPAPVVPDDPTALPPMPNIPVMQPLPEQPNQVSASSSQPSDPSQFVIPS